MDNTEKNKVSGLLFFILCVLVLIFSFSYSAYAKNLELFDNRLLIMAYIMIIRPLIGVSFVLLCAGLLAKVGFLDVGRISAKAKKVLFFIGLILIAIVVFYMLLMGVLLCTGLQYTEIDNWVKVVIHSELYNILYQPFRSTYYKEVYLFRDIVGIVGAFFLFLAKTKLGNGTRRERLNNTNIDKVKVGQMLFLGVTGLVFISSIIFSIYAKYVANPAGESDNIMPTIIYLFWAKPLLFVSTALLITGLFVKIGLLNVAQLSTKAKKMLFIIGLALVVITVLYMLLLGVPSTVLQFTEADNWVTAMIHSELYIALTQPFYSNFGEEMYLIRNLAGIIGALLLYITISKSKTML